MNAYQFFIWSAAIILAYAVLSRGLFLATENARQSLIDLAGSLVDSPNVSDDIKNSVHDSLETVHSSVCAWLLAGVAFTVIFTVPFSSDKEPISVPAMQRATLDSFVARWLVATLGNSLGASIIFAFLFLLTAALRVSFYKFSRALLAKRRNHHHGNHATA